MGFYYKSFKVKKDKNKPVFHDITGNVRNIVYESNVKNGFIVIFSQHTTCSVIIQEESHDFTEDGTAYLLQDLLNILENIIPTLKKSGQYLLPHK